MKWATILLLLLINAPAHAAYILSPNGKQSTSMSFAAAASSPAAIGKTIVVRGIETVSTSVTLPAGVKVEVKNGGYFSYSGSGMVIADKGQINPFTPEMFGAKADNATDSYVGLSALAKTVNASGGGSVLFSSGTYKINRYKTQTAYQFDDDPAISNPDIIFRDCKGLHVLGYGAKIDIKGDVHLTADYVTGGYGYPDKKLISFRFQNCNNVRIEGLEITGNADQLTADVAANVESSSAMVYIEGSTDVFVSNMVIHHGWTDNISVGRYSGPHPATPLNPRIASRNVTIQNCRIYAAGRANIGCFEMRNLTISNCRLYDGGYTGGPVFYSPGSNFAVEPDPVPSDIGETSFLLMENCDLRNARLRNAYSNVRQGHVTWRHCYFDNPSGDQQPVIMSTPYGVIEDCYINTGTGRLDLAITGTLPGKNVVYVNRNEFHATNGEALIISAQMIDSGDDSIPNITKAMITGNRFINDGGVPLTKSFPNISNGDAAVDITFRDNYVYIPASAYKASGTGQHVVVAMKVQLSENNVYETDLADATNFFGVFYQDGVSPRFNTVVRNDRFISPNNLGFRAADDSTYDFSLPYFQGYGAPGGSTVYVTATMAQIVSTTLAAAPRAVWTVYGDSSDGGTTPDSTTLASIAALESAGVPAANIRWLYEVGDATNTFVIDNVTVGTSVSTPTLTLASGMFTIDNDSSATTIDNVTLTGAFFFTMADVTASTAIDGSITLTQAGGTLAISNLSSATTMDNVVMEAGASPPSAPTGTSSVAGDGLITMHPGTSTGATSYNYYIRASADPTTSIYDYTGTVTDGQTKTGLINGTAYHIGYTAVNGSGESILSAINTVTPAGVILNATFDTSIAPFVQTSGSATWDSVGQRLKLAGNTTSNSARWTGAFNSTNAIKFRVRRDTSGSYPRIYLNGTVDYEIEYTLADADLGLSEGFTIYRNGVLLDTYGAANGWGSDVDLAISFSGNNVILKHNNVIVETIPAVGPAGNFTSIDLWAGQNGIGITYFDNVVIQ